MLLGLFQLFRSKPATQDSMVTESQGEAMQLERWFAALAGAAAAPVRTLRHCIDHGCPKQLLPVSGWQLFLNCALNVRLQEAASIVPATSDDLCGTTVSS